MNNHYLKITGALSALLFPLKLYTGILLLLCCGYMAVAQQLPEHNMPAISSGSKDTQVVVWERESKVYQQQGDWAKAIGTLETWSGYYLDKKEPEMAILPLQQALTICRDHLDAKTAEISSQIGFLYNMAGNSVTALQYGLMAVSSAEKYRYSGARLGDIYNKLGITYSEIRQNDSAIAYCKKAISAAEQTTDTNLILSGYFNLGIMLAERDREQEAITLLRFMARKYPSKDPAYRFVVAYLYTNIYLKLKEYGKAKPYFEELLAIDPAVQESAGNIRLFLYTAARYYTATGQYTKARPYLLRREEMLKQYFNLTDRCKNEEFLFLADSAAGNYVSAIKHYRQYTYWKDSIFSLEKAKQLNELQVSYKTEGKDRDIKLLRQKGMLKDATIQQQTIVRNVIVGGALVLVFLLVVGYNRYRSKQRSNRLLEAKQAEINQQNDLLKKLVRDKEWLLREIHHRVKNNLQIVISLLNTQSAYLDNDDALLAIKDSQHRMQAMSLIHQRLYLSENLACIDMQWYIRELVRYMSDCFHTDGKVNFVTDLDKVALDVVQAVPLGLILNECISNAIKYAFPGNTTGTIHISLKSLTDQQCELVIRDNGVGLPADFDRDNTDSLGMSLMVGLSEQLGGTFTLEDRQGVWMRLSFAVNTELAAGHLNGNEYEKQEYFEN